MINPNLLINKNNERIEVEEQDRLRKLAMEEMGQMVKIKETKTRENEICENCHIHTQQTRTKHGWKCRECGVIQKEVK